MYQSKSQFYLRLSFLLLIAFIIITFLVMKGVFLQLDKYVYQILPYSPNSVLYYISRFIANLYFPLIGIIIALAWYLIHKKKKLEALILMLSFSGYLVTEVLLKPIFHIPCTPIYYANVINHQELFRIDFLQKMALQETCYPSGHVASYIVFFGYLAYLTAIYVKKSSVRNLLMGGLISIIILVGPSRIYLHVHWLSDVIAAYFLGFSLLLLIIAFHSHLKGSTRTNL